MDNFTFYVLAHGIFNFILNIMDHLGYNFIVLCIIILLTKMLILIAFHNLHTTSYLIFDELIKCCAVITCFILFITFFLLNYYILLGIVIVWICGAVISLFVIFIISFDYNMLFHFLELIKNEIMNMLYI